MDELERRGVPLKCPNCSAERGGARGIHWHLRSVWCLRCGWSRNLPGVPR